MNHLFKTCYSNILISIEQTFIFLTKPQSSSLTHSSSSILTACLGTTPSSQINILVYDRSKGNHSSFSVSGNYPRA
ncbi:hypothetical protein V6Z11_A04G102800 [Gossypium hirsutum]|uniref:Uncharacterized protein n=2 Tax=Gossypium TaxID=3633 RepID=A0A5D2QY84_GOSTO|nr:hypothetical protein ES288_A04G104600v1 [Gossypium darwinii]TYI33048.1 hypothetical protein ES332_A04G105100v1 [Gossypium tomentosum]